MKIIDLLNKIANGEEMPEKIRYYNTLYYWDVENKDYRDNLNESFRAYHDFLTILNDEIEIIEEKTHKICGTWFTESEYK